MPSDSPAGGQPLLSHCQFQAAQAPPLRLVLRSIRRGTGGSAPRLPALPVPTSPSNPGTRHLQTPQGLFVDEEGVVLGGPNSSLAIITHDHKFVYTTFDRAPPGITVQNLAALIPEVRGAGPAGPGRLNPAW